MFLPKASGDNIAAKVIIGRRYDIDVMIPDFSGVVVYSTISLGKELF